MLEFRKKGLHDVSGFGALDISRRLISCYRMWRKVMGDFERGWAVDNITLRDDVPEVPGIVMAIHRFGEYLDFHPPHLHAPVADGLSVSSDAV